MKSLLIVGAGGYGKLVKEIAELNGFEKIDFLDDNSPEAVGKISEINEIEGMYDSTIVAIGNPEIREKIKIKKQVTLVHPSAVVSKSAVIDDGCVIEAKAVVSANTRVGCGSFICAGAVINHNSIVGEFTQINCNAVVAAGSKVPSRMKVESCTEYTKRNGRNGNELFSGSCTSRR